MEKSSTLRIQKNPWNMANYFEDPKIPLCSRFIHPSIGPGPWEFLGQQKKISQMVVKNDDPWSNLLKNASNKSKTTMKTVDNSDEIVAFLSFKIPIPSLLNHTRPLQVVNLQPSYVSYSSKFQSYSS